MRTVTLLYDVSTTKLSITSTLVGKEAIGGTFGDNNATIIHVTYSETIVGYTVYLAVGAHVQSKKHTVYAPMYEIPVSGDVYLPESVMSSSLTGHIPLQLYLEAVDSTLSTHFFSENQVMLKVLPSIPKAQEETVESEKTPYARVIRVAYFVTEADKTSYTYEYSLNFMPTSVTVLERQDGSTSTEYDDTANYDEVYIDMVFTHNKVTFNFSTQPEVGKVFWIKVII